MATVSAWPAMATSGSEERVQADQPAASSPGARGAAGRAADMAAAAAAGLTTASQPQRRPGQGGWAAP